MSRYRATIEVTSVRTYEALIEADSQEAAEEAAFGIMPFDEGVAEVDDETIKIEHTEVVPV